MIKIQMTKTGRRILFPVDHSRDQRVGDAPKTTAVSVIESFGDLNLFRIWKFEFESVDNLAWSEARLTRVSLLQK